MPETMTSSSASPMDAEQVQETSAKSIGEISVSPACLAVDVTSFAELERFREAETATQDMTALTGVFQQLALNILDSEAVPDKMLAIRQLADELLIRLERLLSLQKAKPVKTENEQEFPAEDYLYVPDAELPSTWKLRITEEPGKITIAQLGRAAAALSPAGFMGNRVDIPAEARRLATRKLYDLYRQLDVAPGDMPDYVRRYGKEGRRLATEKRNVLQELIDKLLELLGWADYTEEPKDCYTEPEEEKKQISSSLMLWKQSGDTYRWLAVYSNNYRDSDIPPEIISAASHQRYVKMVDAGEYPYPQLWHFHVKGTEWGIADWVAYDADTGFALASGTVYPGHEAEAQALEQMAAGAIGVSHGMPVESVQRDAQDNTILVQHQTLEISDLPMQYAANPLTSFELLKGDEAMIPEEKKAYLRRVGLSEERIADIEQRLDDKARQAQADGLESKELSATEVAVLLKQTLEAVAVLSAEVEKFKTAEQERSELTPAVSQGENQPRSAVGARETLVRKGTALASAAPEEVQPESSGIFFAPWLGTRR